MKDRIMREVFAISEGIDTGMLEAMQQDTGLPSKTLKHNARIVLSSILHDYGNFSVQTIDSFTYRLLRSFARDLNLPSRFDVEMDGSLLLARMLDQLMDLIGQDDYVTEILIQFAEEKLRGEKGWQLDQDLANVASQLFSEKSKSPIEQLNQLGPSEMLDFITFVRSKKQDYEHEVLNQCKNILDKLKGANIDPAEFLGGGSSLMCGMRLLSDKSDFSDFEKFFESKKFPAALEEDKWFAKSSKSAKIIDELLDGGLRDDVLKLYETHLALSESYATAHFAYLNIHSLAVLRQIQDLLNEHKSKNAVLLISDFQQIIGDFLRKESPEYIFWRLGERYRHFLFDEFQDTSVLQWHNLYPLFETAKQAQNGDGSLMLVGDAKQAIYRWRGGESDLIDLVAPAQLEVTPDVLGTNYRSLENVVEFNNRFFETATEMLSHDSLVARTFEDVRQLVKPGNENGGLVQIHTLDSQDKKEEWVAAALKRLVEEINRLQISGYRLSDMAVLVRTANEGSAVARELDSNGIRVVSSDSLLLKKEPVINFILSLFKFLHEPGYGINRAEVLHYYLHYLLEDGRSEDERNAHMMQVLSDPNPVKALFEIMPPDFKSLRFRLDQLPLYELIEETVRIFGLQAKAPAYIQQFLDSALDYAERSKPDLPGFLAFWELKKDSLAISMPSGLNAVEIMTIHKSKGLQFPVVFLPFADWSTIPKNDSFMWATAEGEFDDYPSSFLVRTSPKLVFSKFQADYDEECRRCLLDNLNLLYVAFTRPEERLYIYLPNERAKSGSNDNAAFSKVSQLVNAVCDELGYIPPDGKTFELGMATPPPPRKLKHDSNVMEELISEPWRERIRIERKVKRYWEGQNQSSNPNMSLGTLMREALCRLVDSNGQEEALNYLLESGLMANEQATEVATKLTEILSKTPMKEWFAPGTRQSIPLEIASPKGMVAAPDKLILKGKSAKALYFFDEDRPSMLESKNWKDYADGLKQMGFAETESWVIGLPSGHAEPK